VLNIIINLRRSHMSMPPIDRTSGEALPAPEHPEPPVQPEARPSLPGQAPPAPALGSGQVPWGLVVRLGFVSMLLVVAVVLVALGYTAAAAVGLILGVGLAATEIIRRLG
jgi:hypothetical protein